MRTFLARALRTLADPGLLRLRTAAVQHVIAVVSGVAACIPAVVFGAGPSVVVLAVMLSISFTAERAGATAAQRWSSVATLPLVGIAAAGVGYLLVAVPLVGDPLFVLVLSAAIWVRRFGPRARRIGTLIALPFIAVLVVPVPVPASAAEHPGQGFVLWGAAVALVVAIVATGVQWAARASGVTPRANSAAAAVAPTTPKRSSLRPMASTRMAVQMAVTLSGAFLIGHVVFGEHWFWAVLTGYVVASGNRGRGDVLYKGIHRTIGALGGTVLAALLSLAAPATPHAAGGAGMPVLAIAVILALGLWLRPAGYGWWAAAMTAMLSILTELEGTSPGPVMLVRLAAIAASGAFAVAVAWWVLPVRTGDSLRARTAAALAALGDLLVACIREREAVPQRRASFDAALAGLRQLGPTMKLDRLARLRERGSAQRADVIPAIEGCWQPADSIAARVEHGHRLTGRESRELGALARLLGEYRRMLVGAPPPQPAREAVEFPELSAAIECLLPALRTVARPAVLASGPPTGHS
ncbi:FUSC family protein [Rathayibacter sp. KR2-224]|uniref:FUSC family protein n=1 Tax=Rathayibacter sp. KR2-224 TaxID=3400913 RepID=UPI003C037470